MGVFYTRKGDKGKSYVGKKSVNKTCIEIEALGQLDELNSMLGILKSHKITKELKSTLHQIQESLFIIQSHVANIMLDGKFKVPEFSAKGGSASGGKNLKVAEIEKIIDKVEKSLPPLKKFVIPGTDQTSAWLDLMRSKSRNVERIVLKIKKVGRLSPDIKAYLNRLSSLFFALARWETRNRKEKNPTYR